MNNPGASQFSFKVPSNIDEEIQKYQNISPREYEDGKPINNKAKDDETKSQYQTIPYATNYVSLLSPPVSEAEREKIGLENETWLKKYYLSKKLTSHATLRHGSVTSTSDASITYSERSKSGSFLNRFLDSEGNAVDVFQLRLTQEALIDRRNEVDGDKSSIFGSLAAQPYYDHYQRIHTIDIRDRNVLKRHTLWMPVVEKGFKSFQITHNRKGGRYCPLFVDGTNYIPKEYDTYGGCTIISSVFSEQKLPAFVYHCAIDLNDEVYIIGGLVACYKYNEEAPNLKDFVVDGVGNLPPPLLPKIINNPSMINNARLYVMSVSSSHVTSPKLSGSIPPPMLCMKASKLTERHIFFYGGFEIKTETYCDDQGVYHLKKRAFVNSTGYILDTLSYRFSKIELVAQPYKFVTFPTLAPRFGHMQISVLLNKCASCNQKSCGYSESAETDTSFADLSAMNSPTMSVNSSPKNCNTSHGPAIYTIIIFGGYRQTGDDNYEAMNDLWKIEVPVVSRGKRGYYKFGETASASIIPKVNATDPWPSARAFFGYSRARSGLLAKTSFYDGMLERLYENFSINLTSASSIARSKPIFPNIPHAHKESSSPRQNPRKESRSNSSSSAKFRVGSPVQLPSTLQCKKQSQEGDLFVIHGGSDNVEVLSDMWWFDLETETWTQVTTYGKDLEKGMTPINVGIVGQSMVNVGDINISLGGLSQAEVDLLFLGKKPPKDEVDYTKKIGKDFLTVFDLNTQCLQGHTIKRVEEGNDSRLILADEGNADAGPITSFGCQVVQTNGTLTLIGGTVIKRLDLESMGFRGAVLESVLPSISLAS